MIYWGLSWAPSCQRLNDTSIMYVVQRGVHAAQTDTLWMATISDFEQKKGTFHKRTCLSSLVLYPCSLNSLKPRPRAKSTPSAAVCSRDIMITQRLKLQWIYGFRKYSPCSLVCQKETSCGWGSLFLTIFWLMFFNALRARGANGANYSLGDTVWDGSLLHIKDL